jgi:hypothetical protein
MKTHEARIKNFIGIGYTFYNEGDQGHYCQEGQLSMFFCFFSLGKKFYQYEKNFYSYDVFTLKKFFFGILQKIGIIGNCKIGLYNTKLNCKLCTKLCKKINFFPNCIK